jgi:GMP synthase-like glutamine amidotransferase
LNGLGRVGMNAIRYGIDRETGLVWSRVRSQVALPVLQYDKMVPDDNFKTKYELEKFDVIQLVGSAYNAVKWTRKIPAQIKNLHREFWGMKPLK